MRWHISSRNGNMAYKLWEIGDKFHLVETPCTLFQSIRNRVKLHSECFLSSPHVENIVKLHITLKWHGNHMKPRNEMCIRGLSVLFHATPLFNLYSTSPWKQLNQTGHLLLLILKISYFVASDAQIDSFGEHCAVHKDNNCLKIQWQGP